MNPADRKAHFYREVLGPVDVEKAMTLVTREREDRARFGVEGVPTRQLSPKVPEHIEYLRQFTPNALLTAMDNALAEAIVAEFLGGSDNQVVSPKSEADYTKKSKNLLARYCEERGLESIGELSPVVAVSCLFEHSKKLESKSWYAYRSSLLYAFRKTRDKQIDRSEEHAAYDRAIAILVIVHEPPHVDERPEEEKHNPRDGIPPSDLAAILKHLESSTVNRSSQAGTFLMAGVETGLRPGEWFHAEYVEPFTGKNDGCPTLFVRTAKNKTGMMVRSRTLVLRTPEVQALVKEQLHNVRSEIAAASYDAKVPPLDNLIKKVSALVKATAKELLPHAPKRWPTIYSARHQARANFAKEFGEEIAAAMLGHGFDVGRKHYAPKRRGSKGGLRSAVAPSPDVIEAANEMRAKFALRKPASKPWERTEPTDNTEDKDEDAPGPD